MTTSGTVSAVFGLLLGMQGLFLVAALLAAPTRRTQANSWLAGFLGAFALSSLTDAWVGFGLPWYRHIDLIGSWAILTFGPLLLAYVRNVLGVVRPLWPQALPPLIGALLMAPLMLRSEIDLQRADAAATATAVIGLSLIRDFAFTLLALILAIAQSGWCLRLALNVVRLAHDAEPAPDPATLARLDWLRVLLRTLLAMWLVFAGSIVATISFHGAAWVELATSLVHTAAAYALGVFAMLRPNAFQPPQAVAAEVIASVSRALGVGGKYVKSAMTPEDIARVLAKADLVMRREQLWRDPNLSLPMLARATGASPNDVSRAINEGRGVNFFGFVGEYRIEAAKAQLRDPAHAGSPILDIALACGFNSKSAFNETFRKLAGLTPTAWRQQGRADE